MKVLFGIIVAIGLFGGGWYLGVRDVRHEAQVQIAEAAIELAAARDDATAARSAAETAQAVADSAELVARDAVARAMSVRVPVRPTIPADSASWQVDALRQSVAEWVTYADSLEAGWDAERSAREALARQVAHLSTAMDYRLTQLDAAQRYAAGLESQLEARAVVEAARLPGWRKLLAHPAVRIVGGVGLVGIGFVLAK